MTITCSIKQEAALRPTKLKDVQAGHGLGEANRRFKKRVYRAMTVAVELGAVEGRKVKGPSQAPPTADRAVRRRKGQQS